MVDVDIPGCIFVVHRHGCDLLSHSGCLFTMKAVVEHAASKPNMEPAKLTESLEGRRRYSSYYRPVRGCTWRRSKTRPSRSWNGVTYAATPAKRLGSVEGTRWALEGFSHPSSSRLGPLTILFCFLQRTAGVVAF